MLKKLLLILFLAFTTSAFLDTTITLTTTPTPEKKLVSAAHLHTSTPLRLIPSPLTPDTRFCATITASVALHLRDGPSEHTRVLGYLRKGDRVTVLQTGTWWKLQFEHLTGYANSKYIKRGCP
jgi:uncharacterized protein YgiM (DUF1202 family)